LLQNREKAGLIAPLSLMWLDSFEKGIKLMTGILYHVTAYPKQHNFRILSHL
jgi:hypothetical protein